MPYQPSVDVLFMTSPNNMQAVLGRGKNLVHGSAPLGVLAMAAFVEREGYSVQLLDAFALGLGVPQAVAEIKNRRPLLVGISCLTADAVMTVELCRQLRSQCPEIKIILGNTHARIFADYFVEQGLADFVCTGEGEYTVSELLGKLKHGGDLAEVRGIVWSPAAGQVLRNPDRPLIEDLDSLPMPARHLAPMDIYRAPFYFHYGKKAEGLMTSRGCPNQCAFCCVHGGRKPRYRSAALMVQEMDILATQYATDYASFQDSLFMGNKRRVFEFSDLIKGRRHKMPWSCEGHVNFVDPKLLAAMRAAGCQVICYGIESGVQRLLERVNKKQKLERIEEAVRLTKEAGIKVFGLFMLGLPGETAADSATTIGFARRLGLDFAQFSIFSPYPGSRLFDELVAEGRIDPMAWDQFSAYPAFGKVRQIYAPEGRTPEDLKEWQRRSIWSFYLRPTQLLREMRKVHLSNIPEVIRATWSVLRMGH